MRGNDLAHNLRKIANDLDALVEADSVTETEVLDWLMKRLAFRIRHRNRGRAYKIYYENLRREIENDLLDVKLWLENGLRPEGNGEGRVR